MKKLVLLLAIPLLFSCSSREETKDKIEQIVLLGLEQSYYEGQKDALEGDIRIELNDDNVYIWSKSPWDDGQEPVYNPNTSEPIPIIL